MALHTTIHLHNVPARREDAYATWFDGAHREALSRLRGLKTADRYEVADVQIMPDIPQPWRFLSVYDFDLPNPTIDVPALGPLIADARDDGLIDDGSCSERIYTYAMYSNWISSANHHKDSPFSGVFIILANFVPGMEDAYHRWYDEVHLDEVTNVPGHVAMRRGRLSPVQIEPARYCPGSDLIMCAQQTDDLLFTIRDFSARARGVSPSGIKMDPRHKAASVARTVHYFRKISGDMQWTDGVAYAGDMSAYARRT